MSRKNHIITASGVLRTDKQFSHLKTKQKEKINMWLYEEYALIYDKNKLPPDSRYNDEILFKVQGKIEKAGIWLPFCELKNFFTAGKISLEKNLKRQMKTKIIFLKTTAIKLLKKSVQMMNGFF